MARMLDNSASSGASLQGRSAALDDSVEGDVAAG